MGLLVDTHCHLGDAAFDADRAEVVGRARNAGIAHAIVVADTVAATTTAITIARTHGLSATAGVHPHHAKVWSPDALAAVRDALQDETVVAIGETGLDYHYDHSPRPRQHEAFEAQLALAAETGKPVVVHSREADDDMAAFVRAWGDKATLVLHSFSSGPKVFDAGMAVGAYFSFSGMITFKSWDHDDYLSACPPDRLLVETDAPYLAPVPHRGTRNEPGFVAAVAARLAAVRDTTPESMAELTSANAARCFGPRIAHAIREDA